MLIWWPMISGILFESRKSVHFNYCCISFNLLYAFESTKHPLLCVELHLETFELKV